jgi:N-acetylmuramoyl-L-alanine amidase
MDIKLLGSSSIATVAVFALFAQYGGGSQASSLERFEDAADAQPVMPMMSTHPANFAAVTMPVAPIDTASVGEQAEESRQEADRPVLLTSFVVPRITGFLNPDGFKRAPWQALGVQPVLLEPEPEGDRFVVMLDPGHGGSDPGSRAHNGLLEKDLTLDIARRARLFLSELDDIEVLLTRDHDHGLSRQSRVNAIQRMQADMVVSLHFNHLPQKEIVLVETYYAGPENIAQSQASQDQALIQASGQLIRTGGTNTLDRGFTRGSERLARTLQQRLYNEVSLDNPQVDDAGVKQETMFVLTRSFTPGVLIELTCLSNVQEAEKLNTDEYRDRLAAALVDGIRSYRDSLIQSPLDTLTDIGT